MRTFNLISPKKHALQYIEYSIKILNQIFNQKRAGTKVSEKNFLH